MEKNHRKKDIRYIEYLNAISENIKLLRTGLERSQQMLGEKAGVSEYNTVSCGSPGDRS